MMVSEESLADFNARSTKEVSMERFRPNLVIRGGPAYIEDRLARIRIGSVELTGQTMCARCTMTLLDPKTGRRLGSEPLNTLSKYRHTNANQVMFGRNFIHRGTGELQLFDLIEVMETSDPPSTFLNR